ncbi:MAG: tetratricopeptide repeat protein [Thermoplasmata archaeon]|nr:tetratricopeptide repeat protein [Thermoplasmata archaeon]
MRISSRKKEQQSLPGEDNFESGLKLWDKGDINGALEQFILASHKGFVKDSIENDIGACYEKLEDFKEARKHYESAINANPYNFYALKNLGLLCLSEGMIAQAKDKFEKSLAMEPKDRESRVNLARSYVLLNEIRSAIKTLKPIIKEPGSVDETVDVMSILRDAGAFDEILFWKSSISKDSLENRDVIAILGEASFEMGLLADAEGYFRKLIESGQDPLIKSWLGLTLTIAGKEDEGIELLKDAAREEASNPQILQNLAFALHTSNRLEEVLEVYEKAIIIQPDDCVLWNNWGNALYNLERYAESIPKFVVALEKNPDYEIAWNNIGNALEKMHLYDQSLPFHLRAIEVNESFAYAHYAAAAALIFVGKKQEGKKQLDITMSLEPTFSEAWILLAKTKILTSPEEAIKYAEESEKLEPESAEPLIVLAMAQEMAGLEREFEQTLRRARTLAEEDEDEESIAMIEELLTKGKAMAQKLGIPYDLSRNEGVAYDSDLFISEDAAAYWYRLGLHLISKKKMRRALDAFRLSTDLDSDSSAALTMLLKHETDKRFLKRHLDKYVKLKNRELTIPHLERAAEMANTRIKKK